MQTYNINDRVQYNHAFLKSISADYELSNMQGRIIEIKKMGKKVLYRIIWNNESESHLALSSNITRIGKDITE